MKRSIYSKTRTTNRAGVPQNQGAHAHKPASCWRENVAAVVILVEVLARMS